jgi:4-amino-4-deoxy-L-arabinose transferase-like glycosyltransferase
MDERKRPASYLERFPRLSVVTCLVIGLILRVFALLDLKKSLYFDYLLWDERLFHIWAAKISDGTYDSSAIYESSPLPAYLMGFVYRIFSIDPTNIRIMNIGFGVLTCYLVYLIGKQLSGHKIGLAACLLACVYKPLIFYNIVPLKTSIGVFLFVLTVYFFLATFKRISLLTLFLLGIAAGLLFNVRPNAAVLIPLMPLLIIFSWNKQETSVKTLAAALVLFVVGLGLVLSPFVIRNYLVANQLAMGPSQSGFNLFLGNNLANPDPYYRPVPFANTSPRVQGIQFTVEASRRQS